MIASTELLWQDPNVMRSQLLFLAALVVQYMEYCWKRSQVSQIDATVNSRSTISSPLSMLLFPASTSCHVQGRGFQHCTLFSSCFSHNSCLPFMEKAEESGENSLNFLLLRRSVLRPEHIAAHRELSSAFYIPSLHSTAEILCFKLFCFVSLTPIFKTPLTTQAHMPRLHHTVSASQKSLDNVC